MRGLLFLHRGCGSGASPSSAGTSQGAHGEGEQPWETQSIGELARAQLLKGQRPRRESTAVQRPHTSGRSEQQPGHLLPQRDGITQMNESRPHKASAGGPGHMPIRTVLDGKKIPCWTHWPAALPVQYMQWVGVTLTAKSLR